MSRLQSQLSSKLDNYCASLSEILGTARLSVPPQTLSKCESEISKPVNSYSVFICINYQRSAVTNKDITIKGLPKEKGMKTRISIIFVPPTVVTKESREKEEVTVHWVMKPSVGNRQ